MAENISNRKETRRSQSKRVELVYSLCRTVNTGRNKTIRLVFKSMLDLWFAIKKVESDWLQLKSIWKPIWVTLYHWDLPDELETGINGWLDTSGTIVDEFSNYADVVIDALGAAGVRDWITFNEPFVFCFLGYGNKGLFGSLFQKLNFQGTNSETNKSSCAWQKWQLPSVWTQYD